MDERQQEKRLVKVLKLQIIKPTDGSTWDDLGRLLRDVRYRVFRLANLAVSEAYLAFSIWRAKQQVEYSPVGVGVLNKRLLGMLQEEGSKRKNASVAVYACEGALPASVVDALQHYKLSAVTGKSKWNDVIRGKASLPTFRLDMVIPFRCDKEGSRRLAKNEKGDVELELVVRTQPYPRVLVGTANLSEGVKAVLDRMLENSEKNDLSGYRQRLFEIKQESVTGRWFLYVTYDFPMKSDVVVCDPGHVVGIDVGFSCPVYAAIGHGHARLGWREFAGLAARIRALRLRTIARRRNVQNGGRVLANSESGRSGHGIARKLLPINRLEGEIDNAQTTLNHQMSAAIIRFAKNNGAGTIQMEDLAGLRDVLKGTFLGQHWRYYQLQQFIKYKAEEAGIQVRLVNPRYTSRRCSECGFIHIEFDRNFRDENKRDGWSTRFECPGCGYKADADYNAARNLAVVGIEERIADQVEKQGLGGSLKKLIASEVAV